MKPLWWQDAVPFPFLPEIDRQRMRAKLMEHAREVERMLFFGDPGPLLSLADGSAHPPRRTIGIKAYVGAGR